MKAPYSRFQTRALWNILRNVQTCEEKYRVLKTLCLRLQNCTDQNSIITPDALQVIYSLLPERCGSKFRNVFLAATKQLYKWYFPSVCLSVRPSVRLSVRPSVTPFWLCSHHRIIMKFSGVITSDRSDVHAKGQGQRSKVKVTEVTTQLNRFRTVTPVWIHIWWWNDAYSLIMLRRGALLFFKVIRQISRSHGSKNRQIWPRLGVSGL